MAKDYSYRADHIGGLIRPRALEEAQQRYTRGEIEIVRLREIEDAAIKAAVDMQRSVGLSVTSDGGFRRNPGAPLEFDGNTFAKTEAEPLRSLSRTRPIKVAVPAARPALGAPLDGALAEATVIKKEIEALIAAGVDYIQLDAPGYLTTRCHSEQMFDELLQIDTATLSGINQPSNVRIAVHFTYDSDAAHACAIADDGVTERLFASLPADRFVVPMHGGGIDFGPLRLVPTGKVAVLGLIDAAQPALESVDDVMSWIDQAAKCIDGDNLALSPAHGFIATKDVSEAEQRRKLELVADAAMRWWGFAT
jgi:5-methyltetrahydropteroyltriglutamate--homocysteine methyltransferase